MLTKGTLYWITGLAGSGKTTIGTELYYALKKEGLHNLIILDGDILKKIAGGGYSSNERLQRAKRYSNLCKAITDQGISVICCTVAMFDQIREWNRENIEKYVEIYLKVPMDVLKKRDKKNLYSDAENRGMENVPGVNMEVELPKEPDIIIENDDKQLISDAIHQIMKYKVISKNPFNRDTDYWNAYYMNHPVSYENHESSFAAEVLQYMQKGNSLIEFGCGNGRDSLFFEKNGINVVGIDLSEKVIDMLNNRKENLGNASFICEDFTSENALFQKQYDFCYSRFTLHSITEAQENYMLKNAWSTLKNNGLLFIEARSVHDGICGLGNCIGHNEYIYNNHYRRFICREEIEKKLSESGFKIESSTEMAGRSVAADEDPILLRIVASKYVPK